MLRSANTLGPGQRDQVLNLNLKMEQALLTIQAKNCVQNLQLCAFQQVQIAELISLFFLILNGFCSSAGGDTFSQTLHIN